ncbi:MAG: glycosyltransferase family 4 protein [Planctomycetes bacterium]|nr:glycosyltransferase family 4 protein [Planctomycetota bacterium]
MDTSRPRLLFVVNEDWSFCSHRLHLARAALRSGFDVTVATRISRHRQTIERHGIRVVPFELPRRISNPIREAAAITELARLYRRLRPDIVHHVVLKTVLYGSLAARAVGVPAVVNAITGLGHVFSGGDWKCRALRSFILRGLRFGLALPNSCVIFQNDSDRWQLLRRQVVPSERTTVICSAGVNVQEFRPTPYPDWSNSGPSDSPPIVMLPSRMLWTKGIAEFVEAARLIQRRGFAARFVLVGRVDPDNPGHVSERQLQSWQRAGQIEWWGHRSDMPQVLSEASIVTLPSYYREGAPKVLLEAAACARPVVTTDWCGCRDVIDPGRTGLLVPPRDATALADAIEQLLRDRQRCVELGRQGRQWVVRHFSEQIVAAQTLDVYAALLRGAGKTLPAERKAA